MEKSSSARRPAQIASGPTRGPLGAAKKKQDPDCPTPLPRVFNITQPATRRNKIGKDDNFRGLAVSNNVVLISQGQPAPATGRQHRLFFVDNPSGFERDRQAASPVRPALGPPAQPPTAKPADDAPLHL